MDVLEGSLAKADGPASIFIDIIDMPRTPMSFAGVARRIPGSLVRRGCHVRRGGRLRRPYYRPYYHLLDHVQPDLERDRKDPIAYIRALR
ncbi:hypothetical protein QO004_001950 [Rhizobium mesoamericanum]|uniref:hypothetical protein n=1 Tax=Rhizobium mesoamericanum TaxID=1079800 RepID=UPI00278968A5|nr:hypothetical protein [Rhizobium mesoamericanum]